VYVSFPASIPKVAENASLVLSRVHGDVGIKVSVRWLVEALAFAFLVTCDARESWRAGVNALRCVET
jgi:hypothetical protein